MNQRGLPARSRGKAKGYIQRYAVYAGLLMLGHRSLSPYAANYRNYIGSYNAVLSISYTWDISQRPGEGPLPHFSLGRT
jgi:hypothetical protein